MKAYLSAASVPNLSKYKRHELAELIVQQLKETGDQQVLACHHIGDEDELDGEVVPETIDLDSEEEEEDDEVVIVGVTAGAQATAMEEDWIIYSCCLH